MQHRISLQLLMAILVFSSGTFAQQKIMGFNEANAAKQRNWEKKFDSLLDPVNFDKWMRFLASHPHHVGSPQDKINAEFIANLFKQWGYQTEIVNYYVLFPTPKTRILELLGPNAYTAKLEEPGIIEEHTIDKKSEQIPTYNAYSADGDVKGELVYVNRGTPADYEELERMGVDVKGKIVIAKYGGSWRGIKPKLAAEHGAIGCLIYSDPADDGYAQGDAYPAGGYRGKESVQRGSVMDMPVSPGDPLTPGYASTRDAKRLDRNEAVTIMKIPVLPISYADALPLLESLGGPVAPASWRGALPITYHVGPGNTVFNEVHLKLEFNWDIKPLYNVIAKLPGSQFPDEWVIRGNHHDAWVNGAEDPVSGLIVELEEARAISEIVKKGFKLKRTLVFCAWDGEEPALLGSTEWVEDHEQELQQKAVAYINTDANGKGFIGAGGSHTLEPFFNEIANDVMDPQYYVSIAYRRYAKMMVDADKTNRQKLLNDRKLKLSALGSGSDYSPFLQHLGITSMNLGFGGESIGNQYHSAYDTYDHYLAYNDFAFQYSVALAKTTGRIILRLANAEVLPFNFNNFYKTVNDYATEVKTLLDDMRTETEIHNRMLEGQLFGVATSQRITYHSPPAKEPVPYLNFSNLENALVQLKKSAEEFDQLYSKATALPLAKQKELNTILYKSERTLLQEKGLPRRSWYRHQVYAPGYYTGYGVKTLPGIREAIEQRNWKETQENIEVVTKTLQVYTEQVIRANALLR